MQALVRGMQPAGLRQRDGKTRIFDLISQRHHEQRGVSAHFVLPTYRLAQFRQRQEIERSIQRIQVREMRLLDEKESPTEFKPLPRTAAEMMAMRRKKFNFAR